MQKPVKIKAPGNFLPWWRWGRSCLFHMNKFCILSSIAHENWKHFPCQRTALHFARISHWAWSSFKTFLMYRTEQYQYRNTVNLTMKNAWHFTPNTESNKKMKHYLCTAYRSHEKSLHSLSSLKSTYKCKTGNRAVIVLFSFPDQWKATLPFYN